MSDGDSATNTNAHMESHPSHAPVAENEPKAFNTRHGGKGGRGEASLRAPGRRVLGPDSSEQKEQRCCRLCQEVKAISLFAKDRGYQGGVSNRCRACKSESDRKVYKKRNPEKTRKWGKERRANHQKRMADIRKGSEWKENNLKKCMIYSARKRGECFLEVSDIFIPSHCPLLGIELTRGMDNNRDSSPSLDRIDPMRPYVIGNVWVVSYRANRIKNDATVEELEALTKKLREVINGDFQITSQPPHPTYQK